MLKPQATQKLDTEKPFSKEDANKINTPFIIKVNKPNVKIFIGKVKTKRIGFRVIFIKANKTASHNAVQKLATATPGIK